MRLVMTLIHVLFVLFLFDEYIRILKLGCNEKAAFHAKLQST